MTTDPATPAVVCLKCGYPLAGIETEAKCPECGCPAELSLRPSPLCFLTKHDANLIAIGGQVICWAFGMFGITIIAVGAALLGGAARTGLFASIMLWIMPLAPLGAVLWVAGWILIALVRAAEHGERSRLQRGLLGLSIFQAAALVPTAVVAFSIAAGGPMRLDAGAVIFTAMVAVIATAGVGHARLYALVRRSGDAALRITGLGSAYCLGVAALFLGAMLHPLISGRAPDPLLLGISAVFTLGAGAVWAYFLLAVAEAARLRGAPEIPPPDDGPASAERPFSE